MLSALLFYVVAPAAQSPLYKDPHAPVEQRVEDLLKRMTVEEKLNRSFGPTVIKSCLHEAAGNHRFAILYGCRKFAEIARHS